MKKHISSTVYYHKRHKWKCLSWPLQSPDLNWKSVDALQKNSACRTAGESHRSKKAFCRENWWKSLKRQLNFLRAFTNCTWKRGCRMPKPLLFCYYEAIKCANAQVRLFKIYFKRNMSPLRLLLIFYSLSYSQKFCPKCTIVCMPL